MSFTTLLLKFDFECITRMVWHFQMPFFVVIVWCCKNRLISSNCHAKIIYTVKKKESSWSCSLGGCAALCCEETMHNTQTFPSPWKCTNGQCCNHHSDDEMGHSKSDCDWHILQWKPTPFQNLIFRLIANSSMIWSWQHCFHFCWANDC